MGQVQREVFAGSFDGEALLDVEALLGQAAVAVEAVLGQAVGAAEGVALRRVLAQVGQLQEVLLVEPDVVQAQAVPVRRGFGFPARRLGERKGVRSRGPWGKGDPNLSGRGAAGRGVPRVAPTWGKESVLCPRSFTTVSEELEVEELSSFTISPAPGGERKRRV